jgi:hypothetical protein
MIFRQNNITLLRSKLKIGLLSELLLLFQLPYFPQTILESYNLDLPVSPLLSDAGLCTTVNGNSISETFYTHNEKMHAFRDILGNDITKSFKVSKISGSGNIHHKKIWLNVRGGTGKIDDRGLMSVAINDWKDYVSVR